MTSQQKLIIQLGWRCHGERSYDHIEHSFSRVSRHFDDVRPLQNLVLTLASSIDSRSEIFSKAVMLEDTRAVN